MDLQEFIKATLIDINEGIKGANSNAQGQKFSLKNEKNQDNFINFDIAVTVSNEISGSGSGGINVVAAKLDANANVKGIQEDVSRIQFKVYPEYA